MFWSSGEFPFVHCVLRVSASLISRHTAHSRRGEATPPFLLKSRYRTMSETILGLLSFLVLMKDLSIFSSCTSHGLPLEYFSLFSSFYNIPEVLSPLLLLYIKLADGCTREVASYEYSNGPSLFDPPFSSCGLCSTI